MNIHRNNQSLRKRLMSIEAQNLSEEILSYIKKSRRICNPAKYVQAGNMIVTNLLIFGNVRIGRGHNQFKKSPSRYGLDYFTRTYVLRMIDELIKQGYIDQHLGYGDMKAYGERTLIVPTDNLFHKFKTVTIGKVALTEEIELRNKKTSPRTRSKLIDYDDDEFTIKVRDEVKFINDAIKSIDISIPVNGKNFSENFPNRIFSESKLQNSRCLRPISPLLGPIYSNYHSSPLEPGQSLPKLEIRNIFNGFRRIFTSGGFEFGGRYYDVGFFTYQSLSKGIRSNIFIDGEPTVELDFSNMFLMMLYHREGINYQDDGYIIDGYERDVVKLAVNIIFNTKNNRAAISALRNNEISNAKELIDLIEKKHYRLEKYFYSQVANELMRKESDIATEIITIAITEGIIPLPIHDSFIIQKKSESTFKNIMNDVYRDSFKYEPIIKTGK